MSKQACRGFVPKALIGIGIVAAVYVYFLIFAQFAFLRLATAQGFSPNQLRGLMAVMGIAGIAASFGSAGRFKNGNPRRMLCGGFVVAGVATALAIVTSGFATGCLVSMLIGGSVGTLTVTLAASLSQLFATHSAGRCVGTGTGLAYAICNLPAVFGGSVMLQTGVAIAACLAGLAAIVLTDFHDASESTPSETGAAPALSFGALVAMFLALVWLDSAAFYIFGNMPNLDRLGWRSEVLQWQNAGIHLGAAFLAGWLIDRGRLAWMPPGAVLCLGVAAICASSQGTTVARATHWLYAIGVSLYSVALVCAPAADCGRDLRRAAFRAAVLFSVAGWFGSALGIGMAQDLHTIPGWFIGLAVVTVLAAAFRRLQPLSTGRWRKSQA